MAPREDDTYRNLAGGHVRTCTCPLCTAKRLGNKPIREKYSHQPTEQDWQEFIKGISQMPKSADDEKNVSDKPPSKAPGEIRERRKQATAEERKARMERERQAGTRSRPKDSDQSPRTSTPAPIFPQEIRERNLQKHADEIAEYSRRKQPSAKPPREPRSITDFLKAIFRRKR